MEDDAGFRDPGVAVDERHLAEASCALIRIQLGSYPFDPAARRGR
ncbi:MAG: hypothetical protein WDM88_11685 [Galbitalea sp.]